SKRIGSRGESKIRCRAMVISTTPRLGPRCPPVWEQESTRNSLIPCASSGSRSAGSLLRDSGLCMDSNRATVQSVPSYSESVYLCQLCLPRWTAGGYRQVCIPEFKVLFPWVLPPTRSRVFAYITGFVDRCFH